MDKNDPRFDVMLDMSDPDFVEKFRIALDLKEGEELEITTPQFERTDGVVVTYIPRTYREYLALSRLDHNSLMKIGCRKWDEPDSEGKVLWLFPYQWYDFIPNGFVITDINGDTERFVKGETDDDYRGGCLSFGFKKKIK